MGFSSASTIERGNLILKNRNNPPVKLLPVAEHEFYAGDVGAIIFEPETNHQVSTLRVFEQSARGVNFRKVN